MGRLKYLSVFLMIVFLAFPVFASSHKDERNPNIKNEDLSAGDPDTLRVTLGAEAGLELIATTGEIAGMERAWDMAFSSDGNYAYVPAKGKNAPLVWIISISDPSNPSVVGSLEMPNPENLTPEAWGAEVAGNHLYIAAYNCGLWIYDITNPIHPALVGSHYDDKSEGRGLYISGNYCYVADAWNGLSIYDVTNPASPQRLSQYNTNMDISTERAEFHDVKVFGNLAYCAAGNHGLVIVDVSEPKNPKGVSFCCNCVRQPRYLEGTYDWARGIEVCGNYAYLGDNYAGLRIMDVRDPAHPVEVGVYKVEGGEEIWRKYGGGEVRKIEVLGNYVYIPYDNFDFRVVDISNPSNPVEVGFYPIVGRGRAIGVRDRCAYIIEESSFWVIDIGQPQEHPPTEADYERKIMEIAERYPATSLKAMGKLVEWHFQNGRFQHAMEVYEEAINRFSGILLPLSTLQNLAEWHIENGQAEKAEEIYLMAIGSCEGTTYALKAQQGLITLYIRSGKENEAKTAFDKLVAGFLEHPDLVGAVYEIACQWDDIAAKKGIMENYEKANRIYRDIIQKYPQSEFAEKSEWRLRKNLIFSYIDLEKDEEVEKAVDDLIANYSRNPMFGQIVDWIEEKYYNKIYYAGSTSKPLTEDYWRNPIKVWEKVMKKLPNFFYKDPELYWFIGQCYRNLHEYEKAIQFYQRVWDIYPDHPDARLFLGQILLNYDDLVDTGAVLPWEADSIVMEICKKLLEKYPPDHPVAERARRCLNVLESLYK
ncbi:MAG: tetratricopeptide repeat protein [bacterium]|nr:tetratricopeptide repeat protein [bacterium]